MKKKLLTGLFSFIILFLIPMILFNDAFIFNNIVGDIKKMRRNNTDAVLDVTNIVGKNILIGSDKKNVENYFDSLGFKLIFDLVDSSNFQTIRVEKRIQSWSQWPLFYDKIQIDIRFQNNITTGFSGRVLFLSP